MAIYTVPANKTKGEPLIISLSKAELKAVPVVSSDSYYSDELNWNQVVLHFRAGRQEETVTCDATVAGDLITGTFLVSAKAKDSFKLEKVIITDFDNGYIPVLRADLPSLLGLDVEFTTPTPPSVSASGRYFEAEFQITDMGTGGSIVLTEIQVIISGVAKTLAEAGATVVTHNFSNFNAAALSNGSFESDSGGNNYAYGTSSLHYFIVDMGSVQAIEGLAIGFGGFNGMERTPSTVNLYAHDTESTHQSGTLKKTHSTPRSEYSKDVRKDFTF